jgi:hypothetical protein
LTLTALLESLIKGLPLRTKNIYPVKTKSLSVHLSLSAGSHLLGVQSVTRITSNLFTILTRYGTTDSASINWHLGGTTELQPGVFLAYMH